MSIIDIDLSRFDYGNASLLEELYLETPLNVPDDDDFFKLELNEDYKNNKERIERDVALKKEKEESQLKEEKEIDNLFQELSSNMIITQSER
jgi:hypothetical protein